MHESVIHRICRLANSRAKRDDNTETQLGPESKVDSSSFHSDAGGEVIDHLGWVQNDWAHPGGQKYKEGTLLILRIQSS